MSFTYLRNSQPVTLLHFYFLRLTHAFRSKVLVTLEQFPPSAVLVFATDQKMTTDSPRTIVASRVGPYQDFWFYLPRGEYAFYVMTFDPERDVFEHYREVYAAPGCADFIGTLVAT